ncbi:MAG: hypothetical protein ABIK15_19180 [Pseudomonadota bacterium]
MKKLEKVSKDEAKRLYRKEGKDIIASKTTLKKLSKNKGKGKTGQPIFEKHGEGNWHYHTPDRKTVSGNTKGGHGFVSGSIATIILLLNSIDPVEIMHGDLAGPEDSEFHPNDSNCEN